LPATNGADGSELFSQKRCLLPIKPFHIRRDDYAAFRGQQRKPQPNQIAGINVAATVCWMTLRFSGYGASGDFGMRTFRRQALRHQQEIESPLKRMLHHVNGGFSRANRQFRMVWNRQSQEKRLAAELVLTTGCHAKARSILLYY